MIRVHKFKIGEKTYSAVYNLNVLEKLGSMAGPLEDGRPLDANMIMKVWSTQYGLMKAMLVMMAEGERLEGRELDLTEETLKERIGPAEMYWFQHKIAAIMVEAMQMETAMDDDEEVDEVMESIKKKVMKEDSLPDSSEPGP